MCPLLRGIGPDLEKEGSRFGMGIVGYQGASPIEAGQRSRRRGQGVGLGPF